MKKVSILIPHFQTWKWTAACIWHFKQYGIPVDSEIILVNNSPGHPSIKAITETDLGRDIIVLDGDPEFTSHGMGYDIAARRASGDWFFTSETDSFPTQCGWFDEYVKSSVDHSLIGPEIPQSSGFYVHPAGALMRRRIYDDAMEWQKQYAEWLFYPGTGIIYGFDKPYHVLVHVDHATHAEDDESVAQMRLWRRAGPYQEMRAFCDDDWDTYPMRRDAMFRPEQDLKVYRKIGYEAGQWLSYFADKQGYRVQRAPVNLQWMPGQHGKQAAHSTVFEGFTHFWGGTVSSLGPNGMEETVRAFKLKQQQDAFEKLPLNLKMQIEELIQQNQ